MARPMIINGTLLRNLMTCERRVWLDAYGRAEEKVGINPVWMQAGVEHENTVQAAAGMPDGASLPQSWDERVAATREVMKAGYAEIIGAVVEHQLELKGRATVILRGQIDRLIRNRHMLYEPIEIKQYTSLSEADFLQLDLYIIILQQMQKAKLKGYFWLGKDTENHPRVILPRQLDLAQLKTILQQVNAVLSMHRPPSVRLEPHCDNCPWNASCFKVARSHLDLSLLPRLGKKARVQLERKGITDLRHFAALSIEELQRVDGIKSSAATLQANARAFVENRPVWLSSIPDTLDQGGWMFDLETAPLPGGNGLPWSLGWSDERGNSQVVVVVPGWPHQIIQASQVSRLGIVGDTGKAWEVFYKYVSVNDKPIYHWSPYDASVMRKTAPEHVKQALLGRMHDLHHTVINTVRFPLKSYSIKHVATYLGFNWSGSGNWWEAEADYHRWLRTGENEHIARVYRYQVDDVLAVATVWNWLMKNKS